MVLRREALVPVNSREPALEVRQPLLAATAVAISLICAEWLQLQQPGLAVWSTHMVMVQYTYTTFQKGVERALGRGVGILMALVLATLTRDAWLIGLALEMLAIAGLFYIYFCGKLSYTFLNAGLYLAAVMEISRTNPSAATTEAAEMMYAIIVGVSVAMLVAWVGGAEDDVTIHTDGDPYWPINRERMLHAVMLMLTALLVQLTCHIFGLSPTTSIVAVMMLTITPDYQSLIWKGELRLAGAAMAIVYASAVLMFLIRRPAFPLLVIAMFLGAFLAVTLARNSKKWDYAGVQMGLVLPMILVLPHHELGSLDVAFSRIGGAILAIGASLLVGVVWAAITPKLPMPLASAASNKNSDAAQQASGS